MSGIWMFPVIRAPMSMDAEKRLNAARVSPVSAFPIFRSLALALPVSYSANLSAG